MSTLRAAGSFSSNLENLAGPDKIVGLCDSFDRLGFTVDADGALREKIIDNVSGSDLTDALSSDVTASI
ncbi:hypothetical protein C5C31_09290 [Rathayibacter rathayi]|uniref:hypothetical protein n=1 Tax=Rathayibacter rathayi TaxID=33887 RepID=UPI000CE822AD|nr:hypothetical protein [Rathayibacter rathayi]PPG67585.1 hypothetical protein C5C02_09530 [Rathayibacter rathayi]PPG76572.1 hypothetical protein C5C23_07535 [Rathayibacter rathayi]PPH22260.1 hypothetical protein C5C31_09290 [Rathayibacter rathayi]PPH36988.1 hypothetical protein C5C28_04785 [Rathayibacter rathayi]PPH64278.1 hypothetical protein C5C45_12830 [Rathayibacter rathayi]